MYGFTISLTSVLDWDGCAAPRPGRLTPGETRYPLYRSLDGHQDRSERVRKISPLQGFDLRTFQTVANCGTNCICINTTRDSKPKYSVHGDICLVNTLKDINHQVLLKLQQN